VSFLLCKERRVEEFSRQKMSGLGLGVTGQAPSALQPNKNSKEETFRKIKPRTPVIFPGLLSSLTVDAFLFSQLNVTRL